MCRWHRRCAVRKRRTTLNLLILHLRALTLSVANMQQLLRHSFRFHQTGSQPSQPSARYKLLSFTFGAQFKLGGRRAERERECRCALMLHLLTAVNLVVCLSRCASDTRIVFRPAHFQWHYILGEQVNSIQPSINQSRMIYTCTELLLLHSHPHPHPHPSARARSHPYTHTRARFDGEEIINLERIKQHSLVI